jgi:hypothetical protein
LFNKRQINHAQTGIESESRNFDEPRNLAAHKSFCAIFSSECQGSSFGCLSLGRRFDEGAPWIAVFLLLSWHFSAAVGCASSGGITPVVQGARITKVAQDLLSLSNEYADYISSGRSGAFKSANPLFQIIDDRVVIDATASNNANVLRDDLVALGMQRAVAFGRLVSGELPIRAITRISQLESLNFARAASSLLNSPGGPGVPPSPR